MSTNNPSEPFPQICVGCANWLRDSNVCDMCGEQTTAYNDFYRLCLSLEGNLNSSSAYRARFQKNRTIELNHGWTPEILAIISAIVLGVLGNVSHEALKKWVLSKHKQYRATYWETFEYDKSVEILFDFLLDNLDQIKSFRITDDKVDIQFKAKLTDLRKHIEKQNE